MPQKPRLKLTRLELELMQPLWKLEQASIREILDALPAKSRPEYMTVQTIIYRLEEKGAVKRVKKIGNAHVFSPAIPRKSAVGTLIDDLIDSLGGSPQPVMSHLVESGQLGLKELKELEALLEKQGRTEK